MLGQFILNPFTHPLWNSKSSKQGVWFSNGMYGILKTIATMTSQTQNFLIFWLLILDSMSFQIIFKKLGGHRPLKGHYDVICHDIIFH